MALNAQGYFNCLKFYLNTNHHAGVEAADLDNSNIEVIR